MPESFVQQRVCIITGASAGIGHAVARRLATEGFHVVAAARRVERLLTLEREIRERGGSALAIPTDITRDEDRRRLVRETINTFGRIDLLINNAGYGFRAPLEATPIDAIRDNFETNLFGLIALTQLIIPILRAQSSGYIINISSVAGRIARPLSSVYDATKHALEAISDGLREELAPFGIRVIVIQPGFISTEFHELSRKKSVPFLDSDHDYHKLIEKAVSKDERFRRISKKPELIADVVSSVLATSRPRSRYAAPGFARAALFLKRALPERVFRKLIG